MSTNSSQTPPNATRNPLYLGTFLLGVGVAIGGGTLWFIGLFAVFYLMIYVPVMLAEAETMLSLFAQDYERYSKAVPLFAPRFTPYREGYRSGNRREFDLGLYLQHREYRAAIGFLVAYGLLAVKLVIALL